MGAVTVKPLTPAGLRLEEDRVVNRLAQKFRNAAVVRSRRSSDAGARGDHGGLVRLAQPACRGETRVAGCELAFEIAQPLNRDRV